ncbi:hypothetical protein [Amedibacterium intestinale]|uniref:hypothetical protein n=1 Tax=Amedibacterium intestinale TaxID=2583452 RepID=UPI000E4FA980|nr:hypothetical protein [Amedibacterium intestinale]RHO34360.1 hypothetical protein DW208_01185 [Erysipelotrichaceae bacterium AM17-60]
MSSENETVVLDNLEFDEKELSIEYLEAAIESELELNFSELSLLEDEKEKIGNPDNLSNVIMEEVWTQFGNQIGLDMTNETLIQSYNREHPEEYNKVIGDAIIQDEKYKEAYKSMKQHHQEKNLIDAYTGKTFAFTDKPNLDHVVPRKELYDNVRRKQAGIDTIDLANKEENLVPTNESLNKSKGKKSNQQYVDEREKRETSLKNQNVAAHKKIEKTNKSEVEKRIEHEKIDKRMQDKLNADDQLMMEADTKARKAINKDIYKGVAKQTAKKAGKDALKTMAVSALFDLLKSIMNGLTRFFKEKHKSFKLFLTEMKESIKRFINHISNFVRTGVSSFIGTVISEIFGPIVSIFKKLASFIKQGVSSLVEAVRYLTAKENRNKPIGLKIAQVGKIVTAGLASASAIVGGEFIEKVLLQIPVMTVEIPLLGSLANITAMFLSSLLCGVIGAVVINRIDYYIINRQKKDNLDRQIDKKNEILQTQHKLMEVKIQKMDNAKADALHSMNETREQARDMISEAMATIFHDDDYNDSDSLSSTSNDLADLLN